MAVCDYCNREMLDGVSCVAATVDYPDGSKLAPVPNGSIKCHDCLCPPGGIHHPGCDVERCPKCKGQLISCRCLRGEDSDE